MKFSFEQEWKRGSTLAPRATVWRSRTKLRKEKAEETPGEDIAILKLTSKFCKCTRTTMIDGFELGTRSELVCIYIVKSVMQSGRKIQEIDLFL